MIAREQSSPIGDVEDVRSSALEVLDGINSFTGIQV